MPVIFVNGEPETSSPVECEQCEDNHDGTAFVCGSACKCRVNVCPACREWMQSRFKCPFTGEM